ncbi:NDR1/HIN1-like protein 6 [Phragmites australis]|uniref:NDR1/HIN1-like protein 6 n=1 Tax=Phragmites australis TaxID=29695 RepID=UPI002D77D403|nr:NDR1/HIN1-like protein 6 [Phragmites australis]
MARPETTHVVDLEAGHSSSQAPAPSLPATTTNKPSRSRPWKRRGGSCCRRFACCALFFVTAVAVLLGALYLAVDPKLPRYTVYALNVTAFDMEDDLTARARFDASVRFENPNSGIGIQYEEGSSLAVWFREYRLSEGALPAFYQGHRDAVLVHVAMGEARLRGTGVVEAMRHVNEAGGELPLVFRGEVPVRVKVGPVMTAKVTPSVRCDLVLDRLSTEGSVGVKNMTCKFSMKLW